MMDKKNYGVIYVAYGHDYFLEAVNSARSLKSYSPGIDAVLFANKPYQHAIFQDVVVFPKDLVNRNHKFWALLNSPFERTAHIDTDTFICGDISSAFMLLDHHDVAMAHSASRTNQSQSSKTSLTATVPSAFVEFNGGVIFYKKCKQISQLFEHWQELYNTTSQKLDQPTFREAVYYSTCRFYVLPPEYNFTFAGPEYACGEVKILHGRFGRENRVMSYKKYEAIAKRINHSHTRRVYVPGFGILSMRFSPTRLAPRRILKALRHRLKGYQLPWRNSNEQ